MIEIQQGAIFISDAHENSERKKFYNFLKKIEQRKILAPQLIFMGDMFDLLVDQISHTKELNQKTIELVNRLSKVIDIIYLEGNHDFCLKNIFPQVKVISIQEQPITCKFINQTILLSHGDIYQGKSYKRYTQIIRTPLVLIFLNFINILTINSISNKILSDQKKKKICIKIENFSNHIKRKSKIYDIENSRFDFICEGHYHQNREYTFKKYRYKVFPSFACDNSYFQIDFQGEIVFKQITIRG